MRELLQQAKEELEKAYDHPDFINLDDSIARLQQSLEQNGDKGTMLENVITALTQARNAKVQLQQAGDVSSSAAFGQAFNALEQAIESYE